MQLRPANYDAVVSALHDAHVLIGVVLITRASTAISFGIRDALGNTDIALLRILDVGAYALGVLRQGGLDPVRGREQGHDGRVSHVGEQINRFVQFDLLAKFLRGSRYFHERAYRVRRGIVKPVVPLGPGIDGDAEDRVLRHVFDHSAFEIGFSAVIQRRPVLVSSHHGAVPPL